MKFLKLHVIRHNSLGTNLNEVLAVNVNKITYCYVDENNLPTHFKLVSDPSIFYLTEQNEKYALKNLMEL